MSWFTKITGIDKVVERKVQERLNIHGRIVNPRLVEYREKEYEAWASSNPNNLLEFYKGTADPTIFHDRLLFWKWVGGINVPKLHYPAPEALINHMKSLLFGSDLDIQFISEQEGQLKFIEELNKRLKDLFEDINLYDLLQNGLSMATYSGTIAAKFVIDKDVHDKPIVEFYPKERIELNTKYSKVIEIVFKDFYVVKDKTYTLRSYYGKGYVDYKLWNDKNQEVPLATVSELSELERFEFSKKIMMACYMKNRNVSNEFPDSPYGGSDFEGITDLFHMIDETFSTMLLYIRRSRPMTSITEDLLPVSADGGKKIIPKEYEFDITALKPSDSAKDIGAKFHRDIPELKLEPYINSINELMRSIYQKVGMSYTTVGLEAHGANISGAALVQKEKSTVILRNNKVKLWRSFLKQFIKLLLIYDDILNGKKVDLYDYELQIEFPDYNAQSFDDKVSELSKAVSAKLIDIETGVDRLLGTEYEEEEIRKIVRNIKIENGVIGTAAQMQVDDEGNPTNEEVIAE